jgi:hypothetical protein
VENLICLVNLAVKTVHEVLQMAGPVVMIVVDRNGEEGEGQDASWTLIIPTLIICSHCPPSMKFLWPSLCLIVL